MLYNKEKIFFPFLQKMSFSFPYFTIPSGEVICETPKPHKPFEGLWYIVQYCILLIP